MSQICRNCGSQTSQDSVFCEQCGSKLFDASYKGSTKRRSPSHNQKPKGRGLPPQFYPSPTKPFSTRKPLIFGFVVVILIVVFSGALFLALVTNDESYELLTSSFRNYNRDHYPNMTEVVFSIENSRGMVQVDFSENQSDPLVFIDLEVYRSSGSSLRSSNMFDVQVYGNRTLFLFDSLNSYPTDIFSYDIIIQVSTFLSASFDIQVITGEIVFQAAGENTIKELSLETITGNVDASFEGTYFSEEDTINRLNTVTGSISVQMSNIISESFVSWDIDTVTGSIYSVVHQFTLPEINTTYFLDLKAVTGEINYRFGINESNIGYFLDPRVVTGETYLFGFSTAIDFPYLSPNFEMTTLCIVTNIETTTGSITITKD